MDRSDVRQRHGRGGRRRRPRLADGCPGQQRHHPLPGAAGHRIDTRRARVRWMPNGSPKPIGQGSRQPPIEAVGRPVEGTILTVLRETAEAIASSRRRRARDHGARCLPGGRGIAAKDTRSPSGARRGRRRRCRRSRTAAAVRCVRRGGHRRGRRRCRAISWRPRRHLADDRRQIATGRSRSPISATRSCSSSTAPTAQETDSRSAWARDRGFDRGGGRRRRMELPRPHRPHRSMPSRPGSSRAAPIGSR